MEVCSDDDVGFNEVDFVGFVESVGGRVDEEEKSKEAEREFSVFDVDIESVPSETVGVGILVFVLEFEKVDDSMLSDEEIPDFVASPEIVADVVNSVDLLLLSVADFALFVRSAETEIVFDLSELKVKSDKVGETVADGNELFDFVSVISGVNVASYLKM